MEAIARSAGVGERTLYRRFPTKGDLIRAALDQSIAENLSPAIDQARRCDDPLCGLTELIDAAISLGAREHNLLTAARGPGSLTPDVSDALLRSAGRPGPTRPAGRPRPRRSRRRGPAAPHRDALQRAVDDGFAQRGWRRYVALFIDAISTKKRLAVAAGGRLSVSCPRPSGWPLLNESCYSLNLHHATWTRLCRAELRAGSCA